MKSRKQREIALLTALSSERGFHSPTCAPVRGTVGGVGVVSRPPFVEPQARKNKTSAWRPKLRPQAATQLKFLVGLAFLLVSLLLFSSCQQSPETGSKAL